jgi:hypothetical protein
MIALAVLAIILYTLKFFRVFFSKAATLSTFYTTAVSTYLVVIDLTVCIFSLKVPVRNKLFIAY